MSFPHTPEELPVKPVVDPSTIKSKDYWSFSFKYFDQIKFFGLDRARKKWFISFLERLKELSKKDIDMFLSDKKAKTDYKYHSINWEAKNVPIERTDCKWIDSYYLNNEEEYPFVQFTISRALGRVVGFWNESSDVFFIVLLDPHHNIQPSKHYSYKVDDCNPLSCEYSSLLKDIDDLKRISCENAQCPLTTKINLLPTKVNQSEIFIFGLDEQYSRELRAKLRNKSISEIIELGLLSC